MKVSTLRKIQIVGIVTGVTLAVGLLIKFLLPLFTPFIFAFLLALIIEKPVAFLVKKLKWKRAICSIIMVCSVIILIVGVVFLAGSILVKQIQRFAHNYETYLYKITEVTRNYCDKVDSMLNLEDGISFRTIQKYTEDGVDAVGETIVPAIMNNSINAASAVVGFFTVMALVIMGAIFFSKDMQKIKVSKATSKY